MNQAAISVTTAAAAASELEEILHYLTSDVKSLCLYTLKMFVQLN